MQNFLIRTAQDATKALAYFNDFHDGFVKRIEIVSRQAFTQEGDTICPGLFDVVLKIAHYNYDNGRQPVNRQIACSFQNVCQVYMDFRDINEASWNIHALEIPDAAGMLSLVLHRNHCDGHAWVIRPHALFQFQTAEWLEELADRMAPSVEDN